MNRAGNLTTSDMLDRFTAGAGRFGSSARARHVALAVGIALFLFAFSVFKPLDWVTWSFQSRFSEEAASGQIVFIEVDANTSDVALPTKRIELANLLTNLRSAGAETAYIDLVFDRSSTSEADASLANAAAAWGRNLFFVDRIRTGDKDAGEESRSVSEVTGQSPILWVGHTAEWPDTAFSLDHSYITSGGRGQSLASALSGGAVRDGKFEVNFAFARQSIPSITATKFLSLSEAEREALVRGKRVVLSTADGATPNEFRVPTQHAAPPSFVSIYGAETLRRGGLHFAAALPVMALVGLVLFSASLIRISRWRYWAYSSLVFLLTLTLSSSNALGVRVELSSALAIVAIYVVLRSRARWQQRAAAIDPDTGLPTLRALASQLEGGRDAKGHVVVAKVHGYENILKTLDKGQRATYMRKLCDRLRIGDNKLSICVEGQHLAWQISENDQGKVIDHLEGLRAIFAAPVTVDQHTIDVGITFGAAPIDRTCGERCLAAALAASEETTEAFEPVKIASDAKASDTLWDLSLRARIDAAMEAGEVFCVYQPKVDITKRQPVGVEALVRWEDPERGSIPPLHFVMQCEKAGRIEYLTRYVLQSACSAANLLHFRGYRLTMSVNISATLLSDMRIVGIVRNVLQATGFDPNFLVLEITETSRIRDLQVARSVMKALKALGASLSMDDFGVGAANFEALQALPFDEIKIDRQFVSCAATNIKSRAITASITKLGRDARIAVVAEGAETESDLQLLREIGCHHVQGYALAKPMPLTNLLTFLEAADADSQQVS